MTTKKTVKLVPDEVEDITSQWFSKIIGQEVRESTFKLTPNAHAGIGFMSALVRVNFRTEADDKLHEVLVKLLPEDNPQVLGDTRSLVMLDQMDRTEILVYKLLIPELIKEIPEIQKYICPTIFAEIREADLAAGTPYSSVLVMKDLKPAGHFMIKFDQSMKIPHFYQGLEFLSELHAASLSLEKRLGISLKKAYPWFPKWYDPIEPGENRRDPTLFTFLQDVFPDLYKLLDNDPTVTPETTESMKTIEINLRKIMSSIMKAGQSFPCLVHGDLWPHNILVHEDEKVSIKALDWQTSGYIDPAYDIAIYITLCLPWETITAEKIVQTAKEYYHHNSNLMAELDVENKRSLEEFEKFFKTYALAYAFFWLLMGCPILMSNPDFRPKFKKLRRIFLELNTVEFSLSLI